MPKNYAVPGLIIALVISIAAIGCGSKESKPTPTPTTTISTPTTHPTQTPEANESAFATSLDFTVELVSADIGTATYRYRAKKIGTSSLDFRLDATSEQANTACILKGSTREGWVYTGSQWVEFTAMYQDFDEFRDAFYGVFNEYYNYLAEEWTGVQVWTYTVPEKGTVTYTNIKVNPNLPDSLFQPD
jgi:hypothetical protein